MEVWKQHIRWPEVQAWKISWPSGYGVVRPDHRVRIVLVPGCGTKQEKFHSLEQRTKEVRSVKLVAVKVFNRGAGVRVTMVRTRCDLLARMQHIDWEETAKLGEYAR